jgi:hypothetical protein
MYPSDPLQPGPIYFMVPRRCGLFGVHAEGQNRQVNFVIDEGVSAGKGANAVISMLDHYFENFGAGESVCHLHADNCSGQNKNNAMLAYCLWRVRNGLHNTITLNFMIAGHTKFAVDWAFGLIKRKFRHTRCDCLADIVKTITDSSVVNSAVLVGDETGHVSVETLDWSSYLQGCSKFPHLKEFHYFRFEAAHPDVIFARKHHNTEEIEVNSSHHVYA